MTTLLEKTQARLSSFIVETHAFRGDETIVVKKESILTVLETLKTDPEFDMSILMDLTAVDYAQMHRKPRFEVVYHLYSYAKKHRLRVKAGVDLLDCVIDSATKFWPIANWFEREVWDMFGIRFHNHPDLRRILMYDEFVGHPLRKDYPVNKRQPLIGPKN